MATVHPHLSFAKIASVLTGMRHLNITVNDPKYEGGGGYKARSLK